MSILNIVLLVSLFFLLASLAYLVLWRWIPDDFENRRLGLIEPGRATSHNWIHRMQSKLTAWLLALAPWAGSADAHGATQIGPLQLRLLNAGLRSGMAVSVFLGLKTLLTLGLPACVALLMWVFQARGSGLLDGTVLMVSAASGYYIPDLVLRQLVRQRQKILFHALPDALDLMRLCVQAGLGLDAAIERVGREMRLSCPQLSDEFALTGLALRAGSSRAQALRNLSQRMGLPDVEGLVAMLIQADRFGTSISESLEVHSDALRTRRRLIAEEAAAKLPIKLLIPLIFCVFPALMTVLLGPVVISITQHLFPLVHS